MSQEIDSASAAGTSPVAAPASSGPPAGGTPSAAPAAADSETLLTGKTDPAAPPAKVPNPAAPADPAAAVPDNPEGYALQFGKEITVDTDLLGQFKTTAHEMGLTQGQAAKLAALYEGHMAGLVAGQVETVRSAEQGWIAELQADKDFSAQVAHARLAREEFGTPELTELFLETRLGSHPAMVRCFAKIGKALAESKFRATDSPGAAKSAADTLYPNHGK